MEYPSQRTQGSQPGHTRFAICGLSDRAINAYFFPLMNEIYREKNQVAAILDIDQDRLRAFNQQLNSCIPTYAPEEFSNMVSETQPHKIIVASPDSTHVEYILKALEHNLDTLVEKPMVVNCQQARAVFRAEKKSTGQIQVIFNLRYTPAHRQIKRLIKAGFLGRITNIEFVYNLDTFHGASYFYRWNRERALSGGLSVTKGCHHFDLINWLIDDLPQQVFAYGRLNYYGVNSPYNPSKRDGKQYTVVEQMERCPYHKYWYPKTLETEGGSFIAAQRTLGLPYTIQYPSDHPMYIYDESIRIEDTYSAVIHYCRGSSMTYSSNFSAPWEGYILGINGTKGRIEYTSYIDPDRCPFPVTNSHSVITYYPLFGEREVYTIEQESSKYGGADILLQRDLFTGISQESLEFDLVANSKAGAYAVATGEAIWRSIEQNTPIFIDKLLAD